MKFNLQVRDITPQTPVYMAGFGGREHQSEGVLDPLTMKTVLLQANKTLLIVTIDALGSDRSFVVGLKKALEERFGLSHDEVLINFSHTHHSVQLTGVDKSLRLGDYSIGQKDWIIDKSTIDFSKDEAFFHFLRDTALEMVQVGLDDLIEGQLSIGSGQSDFGISRRKVLPNGGIEWAPTDMAEIDKQLSVIKLTDNQGCLQGILYSYGCHTTGMGADNYRLSNDFAGYCTAKLEALYPGATAVFLQACAGEIKPRGGVIGDEFVSCSPEKIKQLGEGLAGEVAHILEAEAFAPVACDFRTALGNMNLPAAKERDGYYDDVMAEIPSGYEYNAAFNTKAAVQNGTAKEYRPCYVSVWQLGPGTELVAIEGEVSTEYSLLIKRMFGSEKTVVLGYSNGVMSYIPTRQMLAHGGYEAECNYFFGLRGPFMPEVEDVILGRVGQMLYDLRQG